MKSLKLGWIDLNSFIKKYYDVPEAKLKQKYDVLKKTISKFPEECIDKVGATIVVMEKEFCIFKKIEFNAAEWKCDSCIRNCFDVDPHPSNYCSRGHWSGDLSKLTGEERIGSDPWVNCIDWKGRVENA